MGEAKVAIVPAYEPGAEMVQVVRALADEGFEVVVVNDGSSESCAWIFEEARACATVLAHERNRGKGDAIKTGLRYALEAHGNACALVTVDADGQHDVVDVVRVCDEARRHPESLVLGSRSFGDDVPLRSKLGNELTRVVFRFASGVSVRDTQTGLRAFSGQLGAQMLEVGGSRYEYEMNVLMECARAEVPLREVGIRTIYIDGNMASHFNPVFDSFRIYREILKFSASSFASFLIDYALFCALLALTGTPLVANVCARVASAAANFTMNRAMVFKSASPVAKSLAQYAALATFVLACNTLLLGALVAVGANPYIAKVAVELAMFVVSYTVQRTFIFKKRTDGAGGATTIRSGKAMAGRFGNVMAIRFGKATAGHAGKEKASYETAYLGDSV